MGVPLENIHILRNHEATRENILASVDRATKQVKPGGRLWFIFIGHGAPARGARQDAWLVGWDVQRTPASLEARSISQTDLIATLEQSAGQPIVILDACFNGRTVEGNSLLPEGLMNLEFADISGGTTALVFAAAGADEYAGPVPGANRPAFSYLMLGALRGWADENGDRRVTAAEALGYSRRVLATLLKQRRQTPELIDNHAPMTVLSSGVDEAGPDLEEMALRGAGATELAVNAELVSAPDAALLEPVQVTIGDINIPAERAYEHAMNVHEDPETLPEEKASAWCALARMRDESNPYRFQALSMCREWQVYAAALRRLETAMASDYEILRQYLALERKTTDQKLAAIAGFLNGYAELSSGGYPHIAEVLKAQRRVAAGKPVKMPTLAGIRIGPNGWTSTIADQDEDE